MTVALILFAAVVFSTLLAARRRPHRGEEVELLGFCPAGHRLTDLELRLRAGHDVYCARCQRWYAREY